MDSGNRENVLRQRAAKSYATSFNRKITSG